MQDGGHIGLVANGNIVFPIAYTISFPKIYSFHTLHKNSAKVHSAWYTNMRSNSLSFLSISFCVMHCCIAAEDLFSHLIEMLCLFHFRLHSWCWVGLTRDESWGLLVIQKQGITLRWRLMELSIRGALVILANWDMETTSGCHQLPDPQPHKCSCWRDLLMGREGEGQRWRRERGERGRE